MSGDVIHTKKFGPVRIGRDGIVTFMGSGLSASYDKGKNEYTIFDPKVGWYITSPTGDDFGSKFRFIDINTGKTASGTIEATPDGIRVRGTDLDGNPFDTTEPFPQKIPLPYNPGASKIDETIIPSIDSSANRDWRDAVTFLPRDPLALDLDLDGIETVAINPSAPILFDHNGDGAASATGWLKGDDGWLVNDLDGDGKITSGKELLGVDTDITVGGVTRKATTGFEALRALDTHQDGDGKNLFDSRDTAFSKLRVWQDKNQNGVTDEGELSTLDALGIVSIQLQETATNVNLGGGNSITGKALVTRRVGASTSTSEVDSVLVTNDSAANLNLADNPFYTDLEDVSVIDSARALPNMQGSGLVHSLREAMSLGTAAASALTSTVQAFATANTRDAQLALIDKLITGWGATSKLTTSGNPLAGTWLATSITPNSALSATTQQRIKTFAEQNPEMYRKVIVLEQFNGQMGLSTLMSRWNVTLPTNVTDLLNNAYDALKSSVYDALTVQTRLKPYLDAINIVVSESGIQIDGSRVESMLLDLSATSPRRALADALDLRKTASNTFSAANLSIELVTAKILNRYDYRATDADLLDSYSRTPSASGDLTLGTSANDTISAQGGNDFVWGGAGNDKLYGDSGLDTLIGGSGNDYLDGGAGNDTYVFSIGDGHDTVYDYDTTAGNTDVISFANVKSTDITSVTRNASNGLVLRHGTSDSVTINNFFSSTNGYYQVEQIKFSDGVSWFPDTLIKKAVYQGTVGNDTLSGYAAGVNQIEGGDGADSITGASFADTLSGGAGADSIYGSSGNDSLMGQGDGDKLYGDSGLDTLIGGSGNDYLDGGAGNDTYVFSIGDGHDTVYDYDTTAGNTDVIQFQNSVSNDQLWFSQSGSNLAIQIIGTNDGVTISNWYSNTAYRVEKIHASGKTLSDTQVANLVQAMASMTPPAMGQTALTDAQRTQLTPVLAANWS